jgi:hypothetical protein
MKVITLAQIKTQLGITGTDLDAAITAVLPAVDAKVKEITGRRWNMQISALLDGTKYVEVYSVGTDPFTDAYPVSTRSIGVNWTRDNVFQYLAPGQMISGDGIPDGAYIDELYDIRRTVGGKLYSGPSIDLSAAATASGTIDAIVGMNIAYHGVIAKLAYWMLDQQSTETPQGTIASKSLGDISISYSTVGASIDGRFGVPSWAVLGLPRYGRGL